MDRQYIFIGAHAEQLGSGVMKSNGDRFGEDEFFPNGEDANQTDAGLLADGKVIETDVAVEVPPPTDGAIELAGEYGLVLADIEIVGTGQNHRITKDDVEKLVAENGYQKIDNSNEGGDS